MRKRQARKIAAPFTHYALLFRFRLFRGDGRKIRLEPDSPAFRHIFAEGLEQFFALGGGQFGPLILLVGDQGRRGRAGRDCAAELRILQRAAGVLAVAGLAATLRLLFLLSRPGGAAAISPLVEF
jgi:hypothetical protein